ncbi:unnamed protein product [Vicia faba]|uniref:Uncharacterized protein n=1 Tax=Vicia faba TaxID=3906 RepID=A0AAV0ZUE1_VICFA|nr:unnamed protein product [Vicia faba]
MDGVEEDAEHKKHRHGPLGGAAKVSVWWNLENGDFVNEFDPCEISGIKDMVHSKLEKESCRGPLSIFCYGDATKIRPRIQRSFFSVGTRMKHYFEGSNISSNTATIFYKFAPGSNISSNTATSFISLQILQYLHTFKAQIPVRDPGRESVG